MMKKLICRPLSDRKTGSDIMIRMNMTASARKCGKGFLFIDRWKNKFRKEYKTLRNLWNNLEKWDK